MRPAASFSFLAFRLWLPGLLRGSGGGAAAGGGSAARMWCVTAATGSALKVGLFSTASNRQASAATVMRRLAAVTGFALPASNGDFHLAVETPASASSWCRVSQASVSAALTGTGARKARTRLDKLS